MTAERANAALVDTLKRELAGHADPGKAPVMQAYMKSFMPFRGIQALTLRRICREVFAEFPLDDVEAWQATVLQLWRSAIYREERYAAIELTGLRRYAPHQTLAVLPMYEEMIVTGAWWDLVDTIAVHRLGAILRRQPIPMHDIMIEWSRSSNLWKRRCAILCQVSFKRDTNLGLLYACIEPNLEDRDFFIRKAIGWALRAYARVDPAEVMRYVHDHENRLSGLSRREALKNARQPQ